MGPVTYADLAVRLVNSAAPGGDDRDGLASVEAYRTLVAPTGPIFGSVADRHAAGAAVGLAGLVTEGGAGCLGTCAGSGCGRVFIGNGPLHGKRYCSGLHERRERPCVPHLGAPRRQPAPGLHRRRLSVGVSWTGRQPGAGPRNRPW